MALSCKLTKNILKNNSCDYSLPIVKDIYLIDFNDITAATVGRDCDASGSGVTITTLGIASGAKFSHIEPVKNSINFTDELVVGDNGNKYRTHTLTFGLPGKYDKDMVCSIDALALGRFFCVVLTADGEYLVLGRSTGLEASAQSVAGGSDSNGITVTLSEDVTESAVPLGEDAVTTLKANIYS